MISQGLQMHRLGALFDQRCTKAGLSYATQFGRSAVK